MNATELLARYPTVVRAIAFVELILEQKNDDMPESSMDMIHASGASLGDTLRAIQGCIQAEIGIGSEKQASGGFGGDSSAGVRNVLAWQIGGDVI